ncbi:hypothetical protein Hypma_012690 [Hypsizygus marmoreus]|uniref:Uncharacterized protein n=1 Tax=Hypsizygus marmoreus TaxID=39966 RepID=A0A369JEG9_HYPMA|nr:hypothetical protein Hypma_012690 [Hypsizygus marmoreus]
MSSPAPANTTPAPYSCTIAAKLIVLETPPATKKNKKPAAKKVNKNKQFNFIFEASQQNYTQFLNTILSTHHINNYVATENNTFTCKVQVPPAKVAEACDIEDFAEYEAMVNVVLENKPNKPIGVTVELVQVEKYAKKKPRRTNETGDSESSGNEDDEEIAENGLTKLDLELARCRSLIEKRHQNDHDGGYTYVDASTGDSVALTPFMMKEWARAIYDGTATTAQPPQTNTFDPANRHASLLRGRSASSASTATTAAPSDIAHMATIFNGFLAMACPDLNAISSTPKKKALDGISDSPLCSPRNTPTKLSRFLQHAEENLGVRNATSYEGSFRNKGYGPDILHLVDNTALSAMGLAEGDVIRLKQSAPRWWNLSSKRKRADDDIGGPAEPPQEPRTPPNIKVRFDKRFHGGGSARLYGPRMTPGRAPPNQDFDWFYFCEARNQWIPMPDNYVPVIDGAPDDDFM